MNRSINPVRGVSSAHVIPAKAGVQGRWRTLAATVLCGAILAGCGGGKAVKPTAPTKAPPPVAQQPTPPPPDKGDPQARFKFALDLMKQKKTADAEKAFMELTKDFPNYSGPQTDLGIIFAKTNRRDAAIAAFTRAATINGSNASAFNWLGIMNREAGNYDRAKQSYEKALEVKPGYAAAELNLGLLLDQYMKRPADALPHYKAYQSLTGGNDLHVLPWIAEIEANLPKTPPKPAEIPEKEVK